MILTSTFSKIFLRLDFCDPNFCYQCSVRAWSYWLGWLDPLTSWALFFGGRSTLHSYPRRVCSSSFGHVTTRHPVAATSLKAHAPHQFSVLIGSCLYQRPTMEECKTVAGNDVNDHWMQQGRRTSDPKTEVTVSAQLKIYDHRNYQAGFTYF